MPTSFSFAAEVSGAGLPEKHLALVALDGLAEPPEPGGSQPSPPHETTLIALSAGWAATHPPPPPRAKRREESSREARYPFPSEGLLMKIRVDVFDPNWGLRVSYSLSGRDDVASAEDYARQGLQRAVEDGHVHKDEEKFCRMRVRRAPEDF